MTFAGLIYHHFESSLCVKIFPAGFHNQIDWTCVAAGVKLPKNAGEKFPLLGI